jgi:PAS domain S-box-containing protein
MKVLFLTGATPADDAAAAERLAALATELQITTVGNPADALAEIRRTRGFHALLTSPTLSQSDALNLIVSLRRDAVPIAIVPIVTELQQGFFASAVASGADDVLLLRGEVFVNVRETLTRIRQSPHLRPAGERRGLRVLYAGKDTLVWNLLTQVPFVKAERATISPDGVCPVRNPGAADSTLRCDAVVIDEQPGDAHPLQVVKSVKSQASDLVVVMLTAPTAGDVETAALDLGADDIVVKSGVFRRRLVATLRNVHQRLELVEHHTALRTREARLRQIVENLPAGLAIISGEGHVLAINTAALSLIGGTRPTDVVSRSFLSMVAPDQRDAVGDVMRRIIGGERVQITFDIDAPDGARRTIELHGALLERDARGGRGVIAVLQTPAALAENIRPTAAVQAELDRLAQALREADARHSTLFESLASAREDAEQARAEVGRLQSALHEATEQQRELSTTLDAERAETERARDDAGGQQREFQAALDERGRLQAELDAARSELHQATEAHAWERASWDNTRRELQGKLNDAQHAATTADELASTLVALKTELRQAAETHEWERTAWESDRRRFVDRIDELQAAIAERSQLEVSLDAVKSELQQSVESHSFDRGQWETERRGLLDRQRELTTASEGRAEIETALETARAELREATSTLAWERASWETARRHHEHQVRSVEEGRDADREAAFSDRQRLEATIEDLRKQVEVERATRSEIEQALRDALRTSGTPGDQLRVEHAAAMRNLEQQFARTTDGLQRELNDLDAERTRMANDLARADARHHWLLECGLVGHAVMTLDGHVLRCNDAFARMFGYLDADDAVVKNSGRPFPATAGRGDLDARLAARRQLPYIDSCLERVDGRPLRVLESATIVPDAAGGAALVERVFVDMNVRSELEDRLRQARRLEEVGRLAAAITPDIDTVLAAADGPAVRQASDLIRQLLRFSRKQSRVPEPVDLNELVSRIEPLLGRLVGSYIDLEVALGATDPVVASEDDLEQLVTTVVVSVRDLLPVGGSLRLETATGRVDRSSDGGLDVKSGPTVSLTVTAAGYGVQPPQPTTALELLASRCDGSLDVFSALGRVGLQVHIPYHTRVTRRTQTSGDEMTTSS